jgi:putative oxidoreductase
MRNNKRPVLCRSDRREKLWDEDAIAFADEPARGVRTVDRAHHSRDNHGRPRLPKLLAGPGNFGGFLAQLGVPLPTLMGYVVTLVELVGGILLIVGLFSRLAALLLTIDLVVAILLVKVNVGLIAPAQQGAGAELDLALIAGFLVILFEGPGSLSLDRTLGIEEGVAQRPAPPRRG